MGGGKLTSLLVLAAFLGVSNVAWGTVVTVNMGDYATANSCTISSGTSVTNYYSLQLDANITLSVSEGGNNGSFWTSNNVTDWRLYHTSNAVATLTAKSGYELESVTFTFSIANSGTFTGSSAITSGTAVTLSGSSASFTVGNSNNKTNGQIKITAVSVTYQSTSNVETPTFDTASGIVSKGTSVGINASTGCTLCYTTDGSDPTTSNTATMTSGNTATVTINRTTTIRAIALDGNANESAEATATYTVVKPSAELSFGETSSYNAAIGGSFTAPTLTNPHNVPVTYSSDNASVASVNSNSGVVTIGSTKGTAIITAHADETEDYAAGDATYTIIVYDPNNMTVEKTSFSSGETSGKIENLIDYASDQGGAGTAPAIYNDGIRLYQISGTNSYGGFITLTAPAGYAITGFTITSTNTYATTVNYTVDGSTAINTSNNYSLAKSSNYTIDNLFNRTVSIFNMGTGSSGRLEIGAITVDYTTTTANVTSAGWATFVPNYNAEFAAGDAYVVSSLSTTTATLAEVTSVPANTPVLLKGEGTKTITLLSTTPTAPSNQLQVVAANQTVTSAYVLAKPNDDPAAFYEYSGSGLPVGQVYLPKTTNARMLSFSFDDATGISQMEDGRCKMEDSVYDLQGRRVAQPQKGLYIVNGRKVVIR